ncbi:MAG: LpxI family protein [Terriglobales bacterium]|jgi:UDP-2,3-diacylglucosamine hydrolase
MKLGLIAGNGTFPFLVLEAARAQGYEVVVAAIREEAAAEIESHGAAAVHWLSLGELSKLIDTFKAAGVTRAVMAGQVKHRQIFSAIKPDWRLAKLLLSLGTRNTDSLLGAVAKVLADEGILLENSTALLEPLLAKSGVLTKRAPNENERKNIEYGRAVARRLAEYDIGQTVVIAEAACVAVEAMEGTDATIERAGGIMKSLMAEEESDADAESPTHRKGRDEWPGETPGAPLTPTRATLLSRALTVVKIAKPGQDMRFDVPVIGVRTIEVMVRAGATCLAVDAGRCLLLDGDAVRQTADAAGIAVCAE